MKNFMMMLYIFFLFMGVASTGLWAGRWLYKITLAIEELLEQRKERKKKL